MPDKKEKSFMDSYREIKEKERAEELKRQSELEAARADRERKARDEYAEKLRQEKLELLKLKQGVISEEDIPAPVKVEKHYTVWERIGNFFYHNKLYLIVGGALFAIVAFLVYDMATTVRPDVSVMFIAEDGNVSFLTAKMEEVLEQYCEDYNGDGKVDVRVSYIPAGRELPDDPGMSAYALQELQADQTKLVAEFQSSDTIIVIADKKACEQVGVIDGVFADLSGIFPGDGNVEGYCYMLDGTNLAEDIGYPGLSEELFSAFREPREGLGIDVEKFEENFGNAVELWRNYINGNIINPDGGDSEDKQ